MLKIENISVKGGDSLIIKDISLFLGKNERLVIFGPNGSGKSTLIKSIMGLSGYKIEKGKIFFENKDITDIPVSERAKLGIGIMYQHPPKIYGIKILQLAKYLSENETEIRELAEKLKVDDFLRRDLNVDLSGGEIKRVELFLVLLQKPKLLLLDEPESGVDIENISIMGNVLNEYIKKTGCSALIITHTGYILDYVEGEKGCVMIDGKIICQSKPKIVFDMIKKYGYEKCEECKWK